MNLKQNILNKNYSPAPDCSGSHEVMKVIFSRHSKATAGSFCNGFRKKTLRTRAIAQSWNRLKKNKTVGKDYAYTIKVPIVSYSLLPLLEPPPAGPFDKSCKWEVHVLEHGKWRKTKENDKTGETVHYTFTQKSLSRKGIKIVVQKGNQKTEELVKPKKATEPKIVKVELLDSNSKKPSKPLSYGQTVIVKVHCTEHEYGMVNVTLWEDDAVGKGHNKINEKNFAQTKQAEVKRGIAETKFVLSPSFAKMAEAHKAKGSSSEGTMHEYYVTATIKD
ncbi:hypothetical protein SL053_002564, partial [Flavobacterium psychrophilum]|nr:hypothetical protein [Flavobacterium psychrophilum]